MFNQAGYGGLRLSPPALGPGSPMVQFFGRHELPIRTTIRTDGRNSEELDPQKAMAIAMLG